MKTLSAGGVWSLAVLLCCGLSVSSNRLGYNEESFLGFRNDGVDEIEEHCGGLALAGSELVSDDGRAARLRRELTFLNGDWEQDSDGIQLIPFGDCVKPESDFYFTQPLKSVRFELKDVRSSTGQFGNSVGVGGIMSIVITCVKFVPLSEGHGLTVITGLLSVLTIAFEGVYVEKGDEKMLCMLGTGDRQPWNSKLHELEDDSVRILLVLKYPQTPNLTKLEIRGHMRSLVEPGSRNYFDNVRISSSQLGPDSKYQFSYDILKSRTCSLFPYEKELMEDGAQVFDSSKFCTVMKKLDSKIFSIEPNWNYDVNDTDLSRFGPFGLGKEIKVADWKSGNVVLKIEQIKCEQETGEEDASSIVTKVFASFRVFLKSENPLGLAVRTGISNTTMAAEGSYDPSTGQLCMVGCLGSADYVTEPCGSQISMYFPLSFSAIQRSLILGSISSSDSQVDGQGHSPLLFQLILPPRYIDFNQNRYWSHLSYDYSKTTLVTAIRKRNQPSKVQQLFKHRLLKYSKLESNGSLLNSLIILTSDLSMDLHAYSNSIPIREDIISVNLEVLSLGPRKWVLNDSENIHVEAEATVTNPQLLNISLNLMFIDPTDKFSELSYQNISVLFLEGLYDVLVGEMYLTGCRKIKPERTYDATERGQDCLIEVIISYPSENTRWLISPTTKISISSKRSEDDPLYFTPITLRTLRIQYKNHREDVMFRKTVEGILRIIVLLVSCGCILSQILHIKKRKEAALYMSFFMLLFQSQEILYCLTDANAEFILRPNESASYSSEPWNLNEYESVLRISNSICKLLGLVALILTLRIFGEIILSRDILQSLNASSSSNMAAVREKPVISLAIYFIFSPTVIFMIRYFLQIDPILNIDDFYILLPSNTFLLRQVVGNFLWLHCAKVQPLSRTYYLGLSGMRILVLLYDCVRDPVTSPYTETIEAEMMNLARHSCRRTVNVVTVIIMIILVITVHFQQRRVQLRLKVE